MSAWLCSEEHLSLLANLAGGGEQTFKLLLAENLRSLKARYDNRPGYAEPKASSKHYAYDKAEPKVIAARALGVMVDDMNSVVYQTLILKQCDCYDYQACETDDYKETQIARLISKLRQDALDAGAAENGSRLYDDVPWGID